MEDGVEKRQRISEKIRASDRERFHKIQKKIDTVRETNNRVLRCVDPTEVGNENEQKKINKEKVGKKRRPQWYISMAVPNSPPCNEFPWNLSPTCSWGLPIVRHCSGSSSMEPSLRLMVLSQPPPAQTYLPLYFSKLFLSIFFLSFAP